MFDFFSDKVKPSRKTEKEVGGQAACGGHVDILKYLVEERKTSEVVKVSCVRYAAIVWPTRLSQILSRRGENAS